MTTFCNANYYILWPINLAGPFLVLETGLSIRSLLSTVDYKSVRPVCGTSVVATEPETPTFDLMDRDGVFVTQYSQKEDGNSAAF